jgi:ABC-2 type transport system ATP-binding protein
MTARRSNGQVSLAIEARGLTQSFSGGLGRARKGVLHGIDLELAAGRSLGLVGPNGSGKSTLLRVLAAIDAPRDGTLRVLEGELSDAAVRRRVGFLPEVDPFPPEMTARGALDLLGSLQGMARADRRARVPELLDRVGLGAAARQRLGRFSKGMLRRFGLAQAFLHRPDLVLLDEPTAGLDAPGFLVLEDLLAEARERGATLVVASHLLSDVVRHGDELCVLIDGRVAAAGAPLAVVADGEQLQIEVTGLHADGLAAVERCVAAEGGRVVSHGPGASALLELYRRLEA